jgi:hypothetical protein
MHLREVGGRGVELPANRQKTGGVGSIANNEKQSNEINHFGAVKPY